MRNSEMELAEFLIYIIFRIPHSAFRLPNSSNPQHIEMGREVIFGDGV